MKKLSILIIVSTLIACSSQVSREKAIEFKENILKVSEYNHLTFQPFIDETTIEVVNFNNNQNCEIDFIKINNLLEAATSTNKNALQMLTLIKEIDEDINLKSNYEIYLNTESEVLNEFKTFFQTLEKTRDTDKIILIRDKALDKLKLMKKREVFIKEAQECLNQKYKL